MRIWPAPAGVRARAACPARGGGRTRDLTTYGAGIDASLPTAILEVFQRGVAAGHVGDSFTSLIENFKKTAA
ncbi:hypothetical protein [Streptosporangium subroseum]|uniref:imine reductase family protein n=1 Tax=Streptosporangium subroseum TaxID=106412 RepID=UPI000B78BD14